MYFIIYVLVYSIFSKMDLSSFLLLLILFFQILLETTPDKDEDREKLDLVNYFILIIYTKQ